MSSSLWELKVTWGYHSSCSTCTQKSNRKKWSFSTNCPENYMLLKIAPPFKFQRRKQCMKPVSGIDDFGAATVRTVYDFFRVTEEVPTVSGLIKLAQSIIFHGENMTQKNY
jgi:hypothetical protein